RRSPGTSRPVYILRSLRGVTLSSMDQILITDAAPDEDFAPLNEMAQLITAPSDGSPMPREEILRIVPRVVATINNMDLHIDAELLDAAPVLKIVANVAIGADNLELGLMAQRGIWATNVPDAFTETTADFTMGHVLGAARRLVYADRFVRSGQWEQVGHRPKLWEDILLSGKTLGIVGYGKIGQAVAKRARAFGLNVIYHRRTRVDEPDYRSLHKLLAESDFVSLHVPLTDQTHHLMNSERLASMKQGAFLINMSRGKVVDEPALVAAIKCGHLGGAGLDVFEQEPRIHPDLKRMDNVNLTPHIGGGSLESRRGARRLCSANVAAVLRGERPLTPLNEPVFRKGKEENDAEAK
ncbi:MAG: D-glycerate dehydrogenase, partial [Dehalococcoidia bacterium]|nr:D-glycerate dehydrogenase [Dehalococcoidia bacterium]